MSAKGEMIVILGFLFGLVLGVCMQAYFGSTNFEKDFIDKQTIKEMHHFEGCAMAIQMMKKDKECKCKCECPNKCPGIKKTLEERKDEFNNCRYELQLCKDMIPVYTEMCE